MAKDKKGITGHFLNNSLNKQSTRDKLLILLEKPSKLTTAEVTELRRLQKLHRTNMFVTNNKIYIETIYNRIYNQ